MATPIGNLSDVTLRALDVLKRVEVVAAEDTRVTSRLLRHYGIGTRLTAFHAHNEKAAAPRLLTVLAHGRSVALVSDAGTPGISDPGARFVAAAREAGCAVVPVPGASAVTAALSVAGIAEPQFLFYGFLPARGGERRGALERLADTAFPLVFFEAPHRVVESVADMAAVLGGQRRAVIARELTKTFETVHVCSLAEASGWLDAQEHRRRGEFVIIVEGAAPKDAPAQDARPVLEALLSAVPLKQAVALCATITGARRNDLYRLALAIQDERKK